MPKIKHPPDVIEGPDGLVELDNPTPTWMRLFFWGTVVFGVGYLVAFPGLGLNLTGTSQYKSYRAELAQAAKAPAPATGAEGGDPLAAAVADPAAAEAGAATFAGNCAACHGASATGGIGPDLTDAQWIYGGEPAAIAHTLAEGTAKGMPSFKTMLSERQRAEVVAFLLQRGGK